MIFLTALREIGMRKCHIFGFTDNQRALTFWEKAGWEARSDLKIMSMRL
jgi:hypothetical protein